MFSPDGTLISASAAPHSGASKEQRHASELQGLMSKRTKNNPRLGFLIFQAYSAPQVISGRNASCHQTTGEGSGGRRQEIQDPVEYFKHPAAYVPTTGGVSERTKKKKPQLRFLSPRGFTFTWWGYYGLCLKHKPAELAHSFIPFLCLFLSL